MQFYTFFRITLNHKPYQFIFVHELICVYQNLEYLSSHEAQHYIISYIVIPSFSEKKRQKKQSSANVGKEPTSS